MNTNLGGPTLAVFVAREALRLHVIQSATRVESRYEANTDARRVFVDGKPLIDVPSVIATMDVDKARGLVQDLLLAQAYPNGL
jgi:hypothetical protein